MQYARKPWDRVLRRRSRTEGSESPGGEGETAVSQSDYGTRKEGEQDR